MRGSQKREMSRELGMLFSVRENERNQNEKGIRDELGKEWKQGLEWMKRWFDMREKREKRKGLERWAHKMKERERREKELMRLGRICLEIISC